MLVHAILIIIFEALIVQTMYWPGLELSENKLGELRDVLDPELL